MYEKREREYSAQKINDQRAFFWTNWKEKGGLPGGDKEPPRQPVTGARDVQVGS